MRHAGNRCYLNVLLKYRDCYNWSVRGLHVRVSVTKNSYLVTHISECVWCKNHRALERSLTPSDRGNLRPTADVYYSHYILDLWQKRLRLNYSTYKTVLGAIFFLFNVLIMPHLSQKCRLRVSLSQSSYRHCMKYIRLGGLIHVKFANLFVIEMLRLQSNHRVTLKTS